MKRFFGGLSKARAQIGLGWKVGGIFVFFVIVMRFVLGFDRLERLVLAALYSVCYGFQSLSKQTPAASETADGTAIDNPEFSFDVATDKIRDDSGWDTWTVYPVQKRLVNSRSYGGPPVHVETFEYEIRDETVLVRLVESSREDFDSPTFEVFNGVINLD